MDYIEQISKQIDQINQQLEANPHNTLLLFERGKLYNKQGCIDKAMNDFILVNHIDPSHQGAIIYQQMIHNIFDFGCNEAYNL